MSKAKHTPGPWVFDDGKGDPYGGCRTIKAGGESIMGDATYYPWVPDREPDWHLIASAPELLEALQTLEKRIAYYASLAENEQPNMEQWAYTDQSGDIAKARAAIAKATGEQP